MSLVEKVNKDLIEAMKAKDEAKLRAIRAIKSAFLLAGTESGNKDINDDLAIKAMTKMAKQRKDSIEIFLKENRQDLAIKEQEELNVIETYLPKQLSQEEVTLKLKVLIEQIGVKDMKEVGKIMPLAIKEMNGMADGKTISETLKQILNT